MNSGTWLARFGGVALGLAVAGWGCAENLPITLKPGWNFIGVPSEMAAKDLAANAAVREVAVWRNGAIVDARGNNLPLARGEGVAVFADGDATLSLPVAELAKGRAQVPSDGVSLQAGVNVLSLPVSSTVSPRIFGDRAVLAWENGGWSAYPNAAAQRYGYGAAPRLNALKPGQGFLVIGDAPLESNLSDLSSQLQPFASESEMRDYLRQQALSMGSFGTQPVTPSSTSPVKSGSCSSKVATPVIGSTTTTPSNPFLPTAPVTAQPASPATSTTSTTSGATNTTSTNTQEQGVDESDIVKHNGKHIFFTASRTQRILYTDFAALAANANPLGEIDLGGCVNVEAMYLDNDRLAVVHGSGANYWGWWGYYGADYWNRGSTLEIFDVADPAKPRKIASLKLDGAVVESRMIGRKLHLAMRYAPYLLVDYPKVDGCMRDSKTICVPPGYVGSAVGTTVNYYACYPLSQAANIESQCLVVDYDNPTVKEEKLIPSLTDNLTGQSQALFNPAKFYAPGKLDQESNTISIVAVDIGSGQLVDKVGVSGRMDTLYMSTDNLYLVSADYPRYFGWKIPSDNETRSKVYRFSVGDSLDYTGSAFVDGTVLNQFSLGEYQGALRIATTRRFWDRDWRSNTDNQVAVLQGAKDGFTQVGVLGGLGKAGETIRSARFFADKGYLVTFRNTDPLYTLDLSDSKNPRKVGELSIPGYSSYLHPIDGGRLLSIGRDADSDGRTKGIQVQLFDINDFANPKLADKRVYGTDWNTASNAENDHKAFTWRSDGLLAFDIETTACDKTCTRSAALKLLRVDKLAFKEAGEVKGNDSTSYYYGNDKYRGLLFDYQNQTWAAFLQGESWTAGAVK